MIFLLIGSWFSAVFAVRIVKGGIAGYLPHCLFATLFATAAPYAIDWFAFEPPTSWMLTIASNLGASFVGLLAADVIFGA